MSLPVYTQNGSVRIKHRCTVIQRTAILFIKTYRNHNPQFSGNPAKMADRIVFKNRFCKSIILISAFLTKILPLEKFRKKDDIRPLPGRLPHHCICFLYIFTYHSAAFHLHCSDCHLSHSSSPSLLLSRFLPAGICWVIQWIFPPPTITGRA